MFALIALGTAASVNPFAAASREPNGPVPPCSGTSPAPAAFPRDPKRQIPSTAAFARRCPKPKSPARSSPSTPGAAGGERSRLPSLPPLPALPRLYSYGLQICIIPTQAKNNISPLHAHFIPNYHSSPLRHKDFPRLLGARIHGQSVWVCPCPGEKPGAGGVPLWGDCSEELNTDGERGRQAATSLRSRKAAPT